MILLFKHRDPTFLETQFSSLSSEQVIALNGQFDPMKVVVSQLTLNRRFVLQLSLEFFRFAFVGTTQIR